jgi:hypothetical protein
VRALLPSETAQPDRKEIRFSGVLGLTIAGALLVAGHSPPDAPSAPLPPVRAIARTASLS